MDDLQRDALIISLIDNLRSKGSWCGETHVQKAVYMLQELAGDDLGFEFILYKHGPYSFGLAEQLTSMRADTLLKQIAQQPYGPKLVPSDAGARLKERYPKTIAAHSHAIGLIAELVGPKGITDLECLATALYVTREKGGAADKETRADRITELKPHICEESAENAVSAIDEWLVRARELA